MIFLFFHIPTKKLITTKISDNLNQPLEYYISANNKNVIFYPIRNDDNDNIIIFNGNSGKFYKGKILFKEPIKKEKIQNVELKDNGLMLIITDKRKERDYNYYMINWK